MNTDPRQLDKPEGETPKVYSFAELLDNKDELEKGGTPVDLLIRQMLSAWKDYPHYSRIYQPEPMKIGLVDKLRIRLKWFLKGVKSFKMIWKATFKVYWEKRFKPKHPGWILFGTNDLKIACTKLGCFKTIPALKAGYAKARYEHKYMYLTAVLNTKLLDQECFYGGYKQNV